MTRLGRGRSGSAGEPTAEYVAAGPDLALVRVGGLDAVDELLVFVAGRVQSFEPLPAAPGDDRIGFPVPLRVLSAADAEFRAVSGSAERVLPRPVEAGTAPVPEPPHPAQAEAERERERRQALERELEQRASAIEWLERDSTVLRGRAEASEAELADARAAEAAACEAADRSAAGERESLESAQAARAEADTARADAEAAREDAARARADV